MDRTSLWADDVASVEETLWRGRAAAHRSNDRCAARMASSNAFDDRVDAVSDETVRLAMDAVGRLRVGRVDQAEDLASPSLTQ